MRSEVQTCPVTSGRLGLATAAVRRCQAGACTTSFAGRNAQSAARGVDAAGAGMAEALAVQLGAQVGALGRQLAVQVREEVQGQVAAPLAGLSRIAARLEVLDPLALMCFKKPFLCIYVRVL